MSSLIDIKSIENIEFNNDRFSLWYSGRRIYIYIKQNSGKRILKDQITKFFRY